MIREIKLRKSIRKYKKESLNEKSKKLVLESLEEAKSLYGNIKTKIIFEKDGEKFYKTASVLTKKMFFVKSPHYIILMSEEKEGYLENIGFIGEQIVLKLAGAGIGTCWIGGNVNDKKFSKKYSTEYNLKYIICISVGYPEEDLVEILDRKRKDLDEIFNDSIYKNHFEAAKALQASPSSMNRQPWNIYPENTSWDYYIEEYSGIMSDKRNDLASIDAGIGLSHILMESNRKGEMINFSKELKKEKEGLRYITSVKFK
ncbi:MAG: nitroreductase family protein [Eubacteriales bacterium]